jgi:hypothetical protein
MHQLADGCGLLSMASTSRPLADVLEGSTPSFYSVGWWLQTWRAATYHSKVFFTKDESDGPNC